MALHVEIDPDLGTIQADERRLEQVVLNLLSNAIKYNRPDGEVWVEARRRRRKASRSRCATPGWGFPPEDAARASSTAFSARRPNHEEKIEGTGLGLSIVKSLIEKHGGHIWVESELGRRIDIYLCRCRACCV